MIHLATRCPTEDDFVERFSPFTTENSIALPSSTEMAVGDAGRFLITLKDRSPIMRGKCEVIEVRPSKREGEGVIVRVRLVHMDEASRLVHQRLVSKRAKPAFSPSQAKPLGGNRSGFDTESTSVPTGEEKTPLPRAPRLPDPVRPPLPPRPAASRTILGGVGMAPPTKPDFHENPTPGEGFISDVPTRPGERKLELVAPRPVGLAPPVPAPSVPVMGGAAASHRSFAHTAPTPMTKPSAVPEQLTSAMAPEERYLLPANPFGDVKTDALASFVECTLYEEYANAPPLAVAEFLDPAPANRVRRASAIPPELAEAAGMTPSPIIIPTSRMPSPVPASGLGEDDFMEMEGDETPVMMPIVPEWLRPLFQLYARFRRLPGLVRAGVPLVVCVAGGLVLGKLLFTNPAPPVAAPVVAPVAPIAAAPEPAPESEPPAAEPESLEEAPAPAAPAPRAVERAAVPSTTADGSCIADVITQPEDARVYWGNREIGRTPIEGAAVPCGQIEVAIRHDRYQPVVRTVEGIAGKRLVVSQRLFRPKSLLVINSTPRGAAVTVNGRNAGVTPARITVSRYESVDVKVSKAGYKPWSSNRYLREPDLSLQASLESIGSNKSSKPGTSAKEAKAFAPKRPKW